MKINQHHKPIHYYVINKTRTNLLIETNTDLNKHLKETKTKINYQTIKQFKKSYEDLVINIKNEFFNCRDNEDNFGGKSVQKVSSNILNTGIFNQRFYDEFKEDPNKPNSKNEKINNYNYQPSKNILEDNINIVEKQLDFNIFKKFPCVGKRKYKISSKKNEYFKKKLNNYFNLDISTSSNKQSIVNTDNKSNLKFNQKNNEEPSLESNTINPKNQDNRKFFSGFLNNEDQIYAEKHINYNHLESIKIKNTLIEKIISKIPNKNNNKYILNENMNNPILYKNYKQMRKAIKLESKKIGFNYLHILTMKLKKINNDCMTKQETFEYFMNYDEDSSYSADKENKSLNIEIQKRNSKGKESMNNCNYKKNIFDLKIAQLTDDLRNKNVKFINEQKTSYANTSQENSRKDCLNSSKLCLEHKEKKQAVEVSTKSKSNSPESYLKNKSEAENSTKCKNDRSSSNSIIYEQEERNFMMNIDSNFNSNSNYNLHTDHASGKTHKKICSNSSSENSYFSENKITSESSEVEEVDLKFYSIRKLKSSFKSKISSAEVTSKNTSKCYKDSESSSIYTQYKFENDERNYYKFNYRNHEKKSKKEEKTQKELKYHRKINKDLYFVEEFSEQKNLHNRRSFSKNYNISHDPSHKLVKIRYELNTSDSENLKEQNDFFKITLLSLSDYSSESG